jgi:branched-chain amino acid transport system substrate-binding protein
VGGVDGRLRLVSPALLASTLPTAGQRVFRRVWAQTGRRPDAYAVYAYEAMDAVLDSADGAGIGWRTPTAGRAGTRRAFFSIKDRRSPIGRYSINANGDTTMRRYGSFVVHGGVLRAPHCPSCGRGNG